MNEEQRILLLEHRLNPDRWEVVHEDKKVLEVKNRRGRRHIIKKRRRRKNEKKK